VKRSRSTHVRSKIVALLASLAALWFFAAYVTVQAGLNLLWINSLDTGVGRPTDQLVTALQAERRLSVVYLGSGRLATRVDLDQARTATNDARQELIEKSSTASVKWAADAEFERRTADVLKSLESLASVRSAVDVGNAGRATAADQYTTMIDAAFHVYDLLGDYATEIAAEGRLVVALSRSREVLAQEDTLMSGILADGTFAAQEPAEFAGIVGAQRLFYSEEIRRLAPEDLAEYKRRTAGSAFINFQRVEEDVLAQARAGAPPPISAAAWRSTMDPVLLDLRGFENYVADRVLERSTPAAVGILIRLALAGGLGLIAVIASIVISITTARQLVRQLERLRKAARELAAYRLPRVVERLQHGERVDVDVEAPPLDFGDDEIGQVGQAFNAVQETAVRVAVEQAELRRSVRDVFLSLARRSQALLHRQLGLLDAMERRATDSEELAELFRIDHLATRMRRNAENLIVLSGATAGRAWRKPVPMVDVLRGALAEVEDYTRVTVMPVGNASLVGRAVGDAIHLLAELIENAVSFSPPQTVVRVGGSIVGNGYAIEIEDRGLGMTDEERQQANIQLNEPPEFKLSSTARLGLYVVGKLAERHGIRVKLAESPYGGTTAIVLLPSTLMAEELGDDVFAGPHDVSELDTGRAAQLAIAAGRHRIAGETTITPVPSLPSRLATEPEDAPAPEEITPVELPAPRPAIMTPSGLPWRQREGAASEPPPGSHYANGVNGTAAEPTPAQIGRAGRGPEEMRNIMSSYRSGTLRGRSDAARLASDDEAPDRTTPVTPESPGIDERG
jgi:signal transduction histidine kinase